MPSGKKSRAARRVAPKPPPVRSTGRTPADTRRLAVLGGAAVLIAVAIVLAVVLTRGGGDTNSTSTRTIPWNELGALQDDPPPWNNGAGTLGNRLSLLGLSDLATEGAEVHVHTHLDVFVNGEKVVVPRGIGIAADGSFITELHTHDDRGVIHVESPTNTRFTLGQFFGDWDVKLTRRCVGRYCGEVSYYLNGKAMSGDPQALELEAHQAIVVVAGKKPPKIPASYAFQKGE